MDFEATSRRKISVFCILPPPPDMTRASCSASNPSIVQYWQHASLHLIERIHELKGESSPQAISECLGETSALSFCAPRNDTKIGEAGGRALSHNVAATSLPNRPAPPVTFTRTMGDAGRSSARSRARTNDMHVCSAHTTHT